MFFPLKTQMNLNQPLPSKTLKTALGGELKIAEDCGMIAPAFRKASKKVWVSFNATKLRRVRLDPRRRFMGEAGGFRSGEMGRVVSKVD